VTQTLSDEPPDLGVDLQEVVGRDLEARGVFGMEPQRIEWEIS
jgi:hypothetical protein